MMGTAGWLARPEPRARFLCNNKLDESNIDRARVDVLRELVLFEPSPIRVQSRPSMLRSRQDTAGYLSKADAITVARAPASDCQVIAVFKPFACFAIRQLQGIRPAPG